MDHNEARVTDINTDAKTLIEEGHPEHHQIVRKCEEVNEAWHKLGTLTSTRFLRVLQFWLLDFKFGLII
jgi:hypothetical protein